MKVIIKPVYYCEYCSKRGLSKGAMKKHEHHCTANINRTCRLCDRTESLTALVEKFKNQMAIIYSTDPCCDATVYDLSTIPSGEDIMDAVDGCPICALALIRGLKIPVPVVEDFSYKKELANWWARVNAEQAEDHGYC